MPNLVEFRANLQAIADEARRLRLPFAMQSTFQALLPALDRLEMTDPNAVFDIGYTA